ncbi:MAG: hypothetical protein ACK58J_20990 [Planctomyces sp.]
MALHSSENQPDAGRRPTLPGRRLDSPFLWELRPDLEILPQESAGTVAWILRDPLRLAYFRTSESGLCFLKSLGRDSLEELTERLRREFPDEEIDVCGLRVLATTAAAAGVLRPLLPGLTPLRGRSSVPLWRRLLLTASALVSFRWRGIDPEPLLRLLYPAARPLLNRRAMAAAALLMATSAVLVLLRIEQLLAELPELQSLLDWRTAAAFAGAFAVVRVLHELGHALVCHHFGSECHELGFLFVCGIPILYCDVSDSWRQPDRRCRLAVAGAGIVAELSVAAVCGLLWCISDDGVLHAFFLQTMLLASLNTVLVNGNPLVRFDGYFIVSDLLNRPNLWSDGRTAAAGLLNRVVFGTASLTNAAGDSLRQGLLATYGIASFAYSCTVLIGLLLFLATLLEPTGLEALALLPVCAAGVDSTVRLAGASRRSPRQNRAMFGAAALVFLLLTVLLTPVSLPLKIPGVFAPGLAAPVFSVVPGRLLRCVSFGTRLQQGDVLAQFTNPELELELAEAAGDVLRRQTELDALQVGLLASEGNRQAIPVLQEALAAARQRVQTLQRRELQLVIRSPRDGILLPPRNSPEGAITTGDNLKWTTPTLDESSAGAWFEPQMLLGWVGTPSDLRFEACAQEHVIKRLQPGAAATVRPLLLFLHSLPGEVEQVDQETLAEVPRELAVHQLLPAAPPNLQAGSQQLYQVSIRPVAGTQWPVVPLYAPGVVRIQTPPLSLAARGYDLLRQTFAVLR